MEQVEDDSGKSSVITAATGQDDTNTPSGVTVGTHDGTSPGITASNSQQAVAPNTPSGVTVGILLPPKGVEGPQSITPSGVTVVDATAERGSHAKISFTKDGSIVKNDRLPPLADLRNESMTSARVSGNPVDDPNVHGPRCNDQIPPTGTVDINGRHIGDDDVNFVDRIILL